MHIFVRLLRHERGLVEAREDELELARIAVDVADGDYYGTGVVWPYSGFLCDYSWSHDSRSADAAGR